MPSPLRFKPGAVGEYFDGPIGDLGRKVIVTVHSTTCAHCNTPTEFPSMRRMMEFVDICRNCMRLICPKCADGPCRPFEKELERQEAEYRLKRRLEVDSWRCY
jgi:hypothetical protein